MVKAIKIDDVKQPGKALPSATSRPILITEHTDAPVTDPMLASPGSGDKDEAPAAAVPLTHTAKTIEPLTAPTVKVTKDTESTPILTPTLPMSEPESKSEEDSKSSEAPETESKQAPTEPAEEPAATITAPTPASAKTAAVTEDSPSTDSAKDTKGEDADRDPDAAISAEEAAEVEAKVKREQELEDIIASGKYAVPINAVQRRRSRIHSILLCVLAVVLLLLLLDAIFDVGVVQAPSSIPHTHFFSKQ